MLSFVESGKANFSQICAGTREAINDDLELLEEEPEKAAVFLQTYKALSGRDLWDDVEPPTTVVKALLKRGRLHSAEEFRLLKGQLDAQRLSNADSDKAESMLGAFEDS
ncbi:hypothetical protein [Shimia sp.]